MKPRGVRCMAECVSGSRKPRAAISWSGGKDCCLALMRVHDQFDVSVMITMFDEPLERSRSHGLRRSMIEAQAERLGLETVFEGCDWPTYTAAFERAAARAAAAGCTHVIFGDIFEDAHRQWTERVSATAGLTAVQPLWGESTDALVREFIDRGGEARLVTVREEHLDASWLGQPLSLAVVDELTSRGLDPAGERGEYHSVVTNCPLYSSPIGVADGEHVNHRGCWAIDLTPQPLTEPDHAAV
jgi:diphthine-ammonia ligase